MKLIYLMFISSVFLLTSCASLQNHTSTLYENFLVSMREPSELLVSLPDKVWQEFDCDNKKLPFFEIERYEVLPRIITPPGSVNQRYVYTLCSSSLQSKNINGTLLTRIYFGNKVLVRNRINYALKPGRWRKDEFFDMPKDSEPGVYSINIEFNSSSLRFTRQATFVVTQ